MVCALFCLLSRVPLNCTRYLRYVCMCTVCAVCMHVVLRRSRVSEDECACVSCAVCMFITNCGGSDDWNDSLQEQVVCIPDEVSRDQENKIEVLGTIYNALGITRVFRRSCCSIVLLMIRLPRVIPVDFFHVMHCVSCNLIYNPLCWYTWYDNNSELFVTEDIMDHIILRYRP